MTVSYIADLATIDGCLFGKLMLRWRGSLWQMLYKQLSQFLLIYFAINAVYRFLLDEPQRRLVDAVVIKSVRRFEQVAIFVDEWTKVLPITFLLGFYVTYVARRWWTWFQTIPWIDSVASPTALYLSWPFHFHHHFTF